MARFGLGCFWTRLAVWAAEARAGFRADALHLFEFQVGLFGVGGVGQLLDDLAQFFLRTAGVVEVLAADFGFEQQGVV
jgi:hypothetical protein